MSKAPLIYYVEDDEHIRDLTAYALHQAGMEVRAFHDGDGLVERCAVEPPDAVLLDIMLPGDDGLVLLQALRGNAATENLPVMMLTAKGTEFDKVVGLDAGADDYLVKPFSFQELEARIKALLRRTGAEPAVPLLSCGDLTLDPSSHRAIRGKVVIDLTVKEYRLLEYLIQNQGTAQSRLTLLKNVWDKNFDTNTNVVDVYVNYLRSKIDKDFDHKLIRTVVGVGYMMEA